MSIARNLVIAAGTAGAAYVAGTWLRYGHPPRPRAGAEDELLDRFMPQYDVCERHRRELDAPASVVLAAARGMDLMSSRIVRAIFRGRELILRAPSDTRLLSRGLIEDLTSIGYVVLAEDAEEIVIGAVTKPWDKRPVFRSIPAAEFAAFAEPDYVKIAVTLRAVPRADGGSTFRTETRAVATDAGARRKFRLYWSFLSPGIFLIREAMLPGVAAAADRAWQLEGDDIYPDARAVFTHAIAIDAPAREVWPWLLQMGCQRGGWYSWDRLDNGGVRSADRIIPELQHLAVGDVLPYKPTGAEGFDVVRIVPERALVLHSVAPGLFEGTWAFVLESLGPNRTRLITRYRARYAPSLKMSLFEPYMMALHAFMERKQLRTIKHHAEAALT